jgi:outer membrane protein assembly factor BamB
MKRLIAAGVVVAVAVGLILMLRFEGGCGAPRAKIAQRKLYEGPATLPTNTSDWPKWRGPNGDGISRETNLAQSWPKVGPTELWSAEVGIGYASPVAAGGRVYLFSMSDGIETLTCFDANSGKILWNESGGKGRSASYPGTRATPSIEGNDVITLGGAGELTCRDVNTGAKRWAINILDETNASPLDWGTASSPLVHGKLIYVQVGQGGPVALAIDRTNGQIAWRSEAIGIAGYACPLLIEFEGKPQLVVFGGKALFGIDPDKGKTLWQHNWETSWDVNASTPIYWDGKIFINSGYGHGAALLQLNSSGPPRQLWTNQQAQSRFQPAVLDKDTIYLNSEATKGLMAIDWETGKTLWTDDNALKLGLGGSFVRLPDDRVISLGERGTLSLAHASQKELKLISAAKLIEGTQTWATPLVYGGRLYVKGEQEFVCYDISASGETPTTRP